MRLSKARKEIVTAVMKDTIFEAAGAVLEEHGLGGITMDRVATSAGLTAGSLYNYFRNKDELLEFVFARLVAPFVQSLEEIAAAEGPAPKKLEKIVRDGLKRSWEHGALIRLLAESDQESHVRREVRPRVLKILARIFEQGIHEGAYRPHNPEHSARMFHGCYAGMFDLLIEGETGEAMSEYADFLIASLGNEVALQCMLAVADEKEVNHG